VRLVTCNIWSGRGRPPGPPAPTGLAVEAVGPTFPADAPVRRIDHLLRRGLPPPTYAAAVRTEVSDHRAVVADW